jgi:O-antigen/teichoic acid export membrane protein
MVGFLLTGSAVGIYNIAVAVSSFLILPLSAFNQIFTPTASRLYHEGNLQKLESVYRTVTRWSFTLSLFPAIATVLYAGDILQIFGEGFTEGKVVLSLFVFAQLTNSLVGPSGLLLMMSDHQYLTLANQLSSGITNAILNYVLIIEYGFIGAALATASVLAGINVLRVIEVWYLEGISPYSRKYFKPIAAGAFSGLMMYGFSLILEDYMLVLIGSVVGAGCFAISLYVLGIEKEEAKLAKGAYSKAANKML